MVTCQYLANNITADCAVTYSLTPTELNALQLVTYYYRNLG